ncbi:DUF1848 domain-containing protein [Halanaerobium salsuginis]|uniref:DUF1848 domain-containing protein n=1 Tax=Halanaerobium salsuginis TaxID=29563 RepID=A0A1I4N8Z9_9FIRM|nr:DUF1848 domain-containing protein [Halanaerobium salsuginis]SFM11865.1 protein of unknown function [Halanaerobium salsuginis]
MIISASRRTDLPAFYSKWFYNRIKAQSVMVRNPFNYRQISKINLSAKLIDCIVFWTKNPTADFIAQLDLLKDYNYYFQFTINPYNRNLESRVPLKKQIIKKFITLSQKIGKERLIWRYDPIILTDTIDEEYHYKYFDFLAAQLAQYTDKCIISFLDNYKKTEKNLAEINLTALTTTKMKIIASNLADLAAKYDLKLASCAEAVDLTTFNIQPSSCIDSKLIEQISGFKLTAKNDKNQRKFCNCAESIDIGSYNSCLHFCKYCYANSQSEIVEKNFSTHQPESPLLIGNLDLEKDTIKERKFNSFQIKNLKLFN